MKIAEIREGLRARLVRTALRQVAWSTAGSTRSLDSEPIAVSPRVVVLGREHYEERRKLYAIRSWRGLHSVVRLEIAGEPNTMFVIGPARPEGREVSFFRLKAGAAALIDGAFFCIPESVLLALALAEGEVARVARGDIEYYLCRNGASQIRGGAIRDAGLFTLSVGFPEGAPVRDFFESDVIALLPQNLRRLPIGAWWTLFRGRDQWLAHFPWKPISSAVAVALLLYLGVASAYLEVATWIRERQLATLGSDVGVLLEKQRGNDRAIRQLQGLTELSKGRVQTHQLWGLFAEMFRAGAALSAAEIDGSQVTLRGFSTSSTTVLAALSRLPVVKGARFDAPVRAEDGLENFTIVLTLSAEGQP